MPASYAKHFGIDFPPEVNEFEAKLYCFNFPLSAIRQGGPSHATKADWFWECVYVMWGPGNPVRFVAHPWAEEMVMACCEERYVGLSGGASSGKSEFLGVWGLVKWRAAPLQTKAFFTSTSLQDARGRIWGVLSKYWRGCAVKLDLVGKFLDSIGIVRPYHFVDGKARTSGDTAGIQLIAGSRSKETDAVGKLIGFKQMQVLMLADELAELTPSLLEACYGNLGPGNADPAIPNSIDQTFGFQMVAASNFKSYTDPFGRFVEPSDGWKSVTVESERWKTKRGVCLHFDGLKSPNLNLTQEIWPIYGKKNLAEHEKLGRNTMQFWRMCRSWAAPEGVADVIYSSQELMIYGASERPVWSEKPLIRLASLDPSFTSGGDRSIMIIGTLGHDAGGKRVLCRDETIELQEDVTSRDPYDKQIALKFKAECQARGIAPYNAAFDSTGSGISFGTLLGELWSTDVLPVKFGGAASDLPVLNGEEMVSADKLFANRVSEVWGRGKDFLRSGQLKGIDHDLEDEMTARHYSIQKGGETRQLAESKRDMKARLGRSPDKADAYFIQLDLAVVRHGFMPAGMKGQWIQPQLGKVPDQIRKLDEVYDEDSAMMQEDNAEA